MIIYPMKLTAPTKNYLWGGRRLIDRFGKTGDPPAAESWELSCHPAGQSVIANGEYAGRTLSSLIGEFGLHAAAGAAAKPSDSHDPFDFPVLIKLIDARKNLSFQVHPGDNYAAEQGYGRGKTEMWLIIEVGGDTDGVINAGGGSESCNNTAELIIPNNSIICGFSRDIDPAEFARMADEGNFGGAVNSVSVRAGDVFFIKPGTIHAIGAGILLAEVQQNCDLTYRVYDYGRVDADGNKRELHIEKAAEVLNYKQTKLPGCPRQIRTGRIGGGNIRVLSECEFFRAYLIETEGQAILQSNDNSFQCVTCLSGSGKVSGVEFITGDTVYIPPSAGECEIYGCCKLLYVKLQ